MYLTPPSAGYMFGQSISFAITQNIMSQICIQIQMLLFPTSIIRICVIFVQPICTLYSIRKDPEGVKLCLPNFNQYGSNDSEILPFEYEVSVYKYGGS